MEVPLRPCALNSSLAASSRRERLLWPALRVARTLWRGGGGPAACARAACGAGGAGHPAACAREALRARAPGTPLPSSLTLAKRALRFSSDLVCIAYKQDRSKRFFGEGVQARRSR